MKDKLELLCEQKESCEFTPTEDVLGDTSCVFGLDADLFIEYVCNPGNSNQVFMLCLDFSRKLNCKNSSRVTKKQLMVRGLKTWANFIEIK